jgi:hypothetical protein
MIVHVDTDKLGKHGSVHVFDFEPDFRDENLAFIHQGKFIGKARMNGHHLTYDPPLEIFGFTIRKGYHTLPWVVYYFNYESFE